MSDRKQRPSRVLSPRERELIRNRLNENQARLQGQIVVKGNRGTGTETMDPRRMGRMEQFIDHNVQEDARGIRNQIARDSRILEESSPRPVSGKQRTAISKRAEENETWLKDHMCPHDLYYVKQDHPDFAKAKKVCEQEFTPEYKKRAEQYKQDMRRLEPDNYDASNLERIRPKS